MYLGRLTALILILALGAPLAEAHEDLQITKLLCAIRDGNFLTFFMFKPQVVVDHPVMTGEISNFQILMSGTRKYLSGIIFTSIQYNNLRITGDTGDPMDSVGRFTLSRLDAAYAGRWAYEYRRSDTEIVRAVFNCSYNDTPPAERRRRWPNPKVDF